MTGYGRAEGQWQGKRLTVELRALNSKQLDLFVKLPTPFREHEAELRQWAQGALERGKVEMVFTAESDTARPVANKELARAYFNELSTLAQEIAPGYSTDLLALVLRTPEVMQASREPVGEAEWNNAMEVADLAAKALRVFRANEGARLAADLSASVARLATQLAQIDTQAASRVARVRERLLARVQELNVAASPGRLEEELLYYAERLDVNEEKVRLDAHLRHFLEVMEQETAQGRKLGFIAQEMGREINTLGSKANDVAMQHTAVQMKEDLEKIKEQVLNVL
jgi:uncharacterized protein (TIGR00255 family)